MKLCTSCNTVKGLDEFSKKKASLDGHSSKCKTCHNEYVRTIWYPKNRKKQINSSVKYKQNNKVQVLATKYGVRKSELEVLLKGGECEICTSKIDLVIDHCHSTNKVRGILCKKCNSGLGFFKDNINSLQEAIKYLAR